MRTNTIYIAMLMAVALGLSATLASASQEPTFPRDLETFLPSSFDESNYAPQSVNAIAGNITAMTIHAIAQTKAWAGYYGNITATITLDDADSNTFYNWSAASPRGQVYATLHDSISWGTVDCFNFSAEPGYANWQTIESYYNIAVDHVDGVNETYTATNHPSFEVGFRTIEGCPTTHVFQDSAPQTANFVNVLLYDDSFAINQSGWIYTTLIENKDPEAHGAPLNCYHGTPCDFQILVNEDGHGTNTNTTLYYFWVEII